MKLLHLILTLEETLQHWTTSYGGYIYILLFLILFLETGIIVMAFLPGDSLLLTLGILCSTGHFDFWILILVLSIGAILGDQLNYQLGQWFGNYIFKKDRKFIKKKHLNITTKYFQKYGAITILIARFIPMVRTYAPFIAGTAAMPRKKFISYNIMGGTLWIITLLGAGYYLGQYPWIKQHYLWVILSMSVISMLPMVISYFKNRAV
ncbi:DedA family protein [Zhouia sp. PK063]|uniref:DedA family protein n=1 Tax=Zhouia sp. PK063 TaxID=3373602 RepID=UPI0037B2DC57